MWMEESNTQSY